LSFIISCTNNTQNIRWRSIGHSFPGQYIHISRASNMPSSNYPDIVLSASARYHLQSPAFPSGPNLSCLDQKTTNTQRCLSLPVMWVTMNELLLLIGWVVTPYCMGSRVMEFFEGYLFTKTIAASRRL
jgi:hypothetical protein